MLYIMGNLFTPPFSDDNFCSHWIIHQFCKKNEVGYSDFICGIWCWLSRPTSCESFKGVGHQTSARYLISHSCFCKNMLVLCMVLATHSHVTPVAATQLQWQLSHMNMIFNGQTLFWPLALKWDGMNTPLATNCCLIVASEQLQTQVINNGLATWHTQPDWNWEGVIALIYLAPFPGSLVIFLKQRHFIMYKEFLF